MDLPAYLEALAPRVGAPALVVGLDSGCGNYEQLWGTTSLRGLVNGVLKNARSALGRPCFLNRRALVLPQECDFG